MVGKTHMAVGAAAGFGVFAIAGIVPSIIGIIAAVFGALIPDIDHHNSKITTANFATKAISWFVRKVLLPTEAFILNMFSRLLGKAGIPFSQATAGHRGPLTHSLVGVALMSVIFIPVFFLSKTAFTFIVIGMVSHVLIDMLNPEGVPIAYPLSSKKISLLPHSLAIKTGTKKEALVKTAALGACVIFCAVACGATLI